MYVRVEYQGKSYYSYVFAYFSYDYMPQYVVYDPIDEKFDIVAYFSKKCDGHRQIGCMNEIEKDFVRKLELELNRGVVNNCAGYSWLIENVDLIKAIEEGKEISEEYVNLAKEMNATIDPDKWNEIINEDDAENMMNHVGGFHDWYLVSINAISNPYGYEDDCKVQLKFNSQAAFDVLLEFDSAYIKYSFCPFNRIYLSSVIIANGNIYWVDGEEELEISDIEHYNYIQGNKLKWKFVLKEENDW